MKLSHVQIWCIASIAVLAAGSALVQAQTDPVFTYQGQLKQGGQPFSGMMMMQFSLYDDPEFGTQIGSPYVSMPPVQVDNGLFTVEIDVTVFGPAAFDGNPRWLQIDVNDGGWITLSPRQPITPAPYALYAFDGAGGGGDSLWELSGSDIYYNAGNVGIGNEYPWARLDIVGSGEDPVVWAENGDDGTYATLVDMGTGVLGSTANPDGAGVYGSNHSWDAGLCVGIWGHVSNPDGYAGFFEGRGYFTDDVGIGRAPTARLDVAGTVKVDAFQLTDSPVSGYVLTADETGVGTWQPAGAGSSPWTVAGSDIYYNNGNVGIGTQNPIYPLHAVSDTTRTMYVNNNAISGSVAAVEAYCDSASGSAVRAYAGNDSGNTHGLDAYAVSPDGHAVYAFNEADLGNAYAVYGETNGLDGIAVYGHAVNGEENSAGIGVYGRSDSDHYGTGVYGEATNTGGITYGVHGVSTHGIGVRGNNQDSGNDGRLGTANEGVWGRTIIPGGIGVKGEAAASDGYGVYGVNTADTGNAIGGYFKTNSDDGRAVYGEAMTALSGYAGYFVGRSYFSSNVGIGTAQPSSPLTVAGVVESLTGGFKFPDGTIQTTAGGGGDSLWQQNGDEIYYNTGDVGVGVSDPDSQLHVAGGQWDLEYTEGDFKIGGGTYRMKMGVCTAGGETGACRIFAGGPGSRLILGANGTDRLTVSSSEVDIAGPLEVDGFQLTASPASGYVLTCDSAGNGSWQPGGGGGFSLPYSGTTSTGGIAFNITNTGADMAKGIQAKIENATSGEACAGKFIATGCSGNAIYATSDDTTVNALHVGSAGNAFYGLSSGSGGAYVTCIGENGYGIKALATGSWAYNIGGWFEASGSNGVGVHIETTGPFGTAIEALAEGSDGIGIVAKGARKAASLHGDVTLYEYGTETIVLEMGKGLDYAEGFDVSTDDAEIEPGTVLVIDADNPGELAISTQPYDRKVAGIVAGAKGLGSGVRLGGDEFDQDVALAGRVYCNVVALDEPIEPGDLLTTSDVPGCAMRVTDHQRAQGAVIGKAMQPLAQGERGQILVLVMPQ